MTNPNPHATHPIEAPTASEAGFLRWLAAQLKPYEKLTLGLNSIADMLIRLDADNAKLRERWWLSHGCGIVALYGDDGEMQCNACMGDFKRDTVAELERKVTAAAVIRCEERQAAMAQLNDQITACLVQSEAARAARA